MSSVTSATGLTDRVPELTRPAAASASAQRRRQLHVGHFAFMRAVIHGLDPQVSWQRYLGAEGQRGDPGAVQRMMGWIRGEFAAVARREHRYGTARLVQFDLRQLKARTSTLPSLEAFAAERGVEDFSQAEQLELYEAQYGPQLKRTHKSARLLQRQLEALRWLELLVVQPPRAGDGLVSWLEPALARRLGDADLFTVAQLVQRINGLGLRWYSGIRGLGPAKGQRIVRWLQENQQSIGLALGAHVARPRKELFRHELARVVAPAADIRPLEKFVPPAELDGSQGAYRRPAAQCLLKAANDYEAVLAWLRSKTGLTPEQIAERKARRRERSIGVDVGGHQPLAWLESLSNTQRAYRKEAERFMLWAVVQQRKALSSITHEDCIAYREFLADPQPRARWCAGRARERWSPLWRPFEGPLGAVAQRHALTILKNLYGFLVDQNYLMGNPWTALAVPRQVGPKLNVGRSLSVAQWKFAQEQARELGDTATASRLRLTLQLLYATGLRLSEVVAATVDDLSWASYPGGEDEAPIEGWILRVIGKGQRLREVPVPEDVIELLRQTLVQRGLKREITDIGNQGAFLLGRTHGKAQVEPGSAAARVLRLGPKAPPADPREGVAASTLYGQLKRFFGGCAAKMRAAGDERAAERFEAASTHWLRHTHASHAIARGMPIEVAQQNLGHASLATTTAYVTTESRRRMQAVREFWEKR